MTHLVQAACVSLADVRRFNTNTNSSNTKNENFHIKYVKRCNNLDLSPPSSKGSNLELNSNHFHQSNQTYSVKNVMAESNTTFAPAQDFIQPIASSTIIHPNHQTFVHETNGKHQPRIYENVNYDSSPDNKFLQPSNNNSNNSTKNKSSKSITLFSYYLYIRIR